MLDNILNNTTMFLLILCNDQRTVIHQSAMVLKGGCEFEARGL